MHPKLKGKPECLGFRKTVVLNIDEHSFLNWLLTNSRSAWNNERDGIIDGLIEKINAPTPPPN